VSRIPNLTLIGVEVDPPIFITHRYYVKRWVKPDADAGPKFEADPHFIEQTFNPSNVL
jgi:hypothetical protein